MDDSADQFPQVLFSEVYPSLVSNRAPARQRTISVDHCVSILKMKTVELFRQQEQ